MTRDDDSIEEFQRDRDYTTQHTRKHACINNSIENKSAHARVMDAIDLMDKPNDKKLNSNNDKDGSYSNIVELA